MSQTIVMTGPERRRRWSETQKLDLLAAAFGPDGSVTDVARRADICTSLLYRCLRDYRARLASPAFIPAVVKEDNGPMSAAAAPAGAAIIVVLAGRATVTIGGDASPALVRATLGALR